MKINKSSWHYRFNSFFEGWIPLRSLCRYFWSTVGHIALVVLTVTCLLGFAALIAALIIGGLILRPIVTIGSVATGFTIAGILVLIARYRNKRRLHAYRIPEKEPGLIRSYARAAKSRLCPIIEYVKE